MFLLNLFCIHSTQLFGNSGITLLTGMVGEIEKFIRNLSLIDYKMYIENKVLQFQSFLNLLYCA